MSIPSLTTSSIEVSLADAGIDYTWSKEANTYFYFFALEGMRLRLTTQSLTAWAPERDTEQSLEAFEQGRQASMALIGKVLEIASKRLRLSLKPELVPTQEHNAFQNDEYAKDVIKAKHKVTIKDNRGKARITVDASKTDVESGTKIPEIEFMSAMPIKGNTLSYEDSIKYVKYVKDVCDGKIDERYEAQLKVNEGLQNSLKLVIDNFNEIREITLKTSLDVQAIKTKLLEVRK